MEDLEKMRRLLQEGRKAANGTYYPHVGDLSWWLFYPPVEFERWKDIYMWDDPDNLDRLLGWALLSPDGYLFDVYLQPEERGSDRAEAMYLWAEMQVQELARRGGKDKIGVMWIFETDALLRGHLNRRGFTLVSWDVFMSQRLDDPLPSPVLPAGFQVRGCRGEAELEARALAQRGAFGTQIPLDQYLGRWQRFMRSPVYDPDLDVVVAAPEGRIAAFCLAWLDPMNQVGNFEPVGTHPDFQGRGLGKAVLFEALHRLQQRGIRQAVVCTPESNLPAVKLYKSVGFAVENRLGYFEKRIDL